MPVTVHPFYQGKMGIDLMQSARKVPMPVFVRGLLGNWQSYCNGIFFVNTAIIQYQRAKMMSRSFRIVEDKIEEAEFF